ncbi:MAG: glycosyltransferase family 4 protein, partial [Gemmataceae bacterium]
MRVIFNGLPAYRPRTGVGSYVVHLLAELQRVAGDGAVTPFPHGLAARVAGLAGRVLARRQRRGPKTNPAGSTPSWRDRVKRRLRAAAQSASRRAFALASRRGYDLYHEPNFIPWPSDLPTVVTVHDLSVLLHPEWHPAHRVAFHERHFERSLARCRHVLTDSECVRREIISAVGLPPERVTGIPIGVRDDFRPLSEEEIRPVLKRLGLPATFLLHVGTIEPRKNHLTLLKAYCDLPAALRNQHPLVLVGPWGWNYAAVRDFYESEARHRGVIHLGYLSDDVLPALYNAARALVYPSYYEGFGLPPAEMLACGGAVLASTAPTLREVLGNCAWYHDPDDLAGWRDAMAAVLTDDD